MSSSATKMSLVLILIVSLVQFTAAMSQREINRLRRETTKMFYHGFDNYMNIAFPEDEIRPISCRPLTRDANPANIGLNDVLGNYSLTLIDSLSTLAILASSSDRTEGQNALARFQEGIVNLVEQYGDGSPGPAGMGLRGRGFDVDSKVQVFETVIRGLGGLLSAHLFATGELPIKGYSNAVQGRPIIKWPNGFKYDGQLLRLAHDLGKRILPAFVTPTDLPYPRVNLRHGTPFYGNSTKAVPDDQCEAEPKPPREITETCAAGAGSLVLEMTVLSRLTGDPRFEMSAKKAFWAVWKRRSPIGLVGAGIDAESGAWVGPITGIGAGVDSFFEYALKSHILLSGDTRQNDSSSHTSDQVITFEENSANSFLSTWKEAHAAIKRHLYRDNHHPHYLNVHLSTGSTQAYWIDSLSAYYPGLLTLSGELEEAVKAHLFYTALWTRYSALPERWSARESGVEGGLGWWPGRPEFVESNYYLYRATRDPWYLHVGEMVLRDIQRRCWAECGWAGLQDVRSGQLSDRMESFFLGETAKYLFLLYDPNHPLNKLDAPFVFTTEGHPLILPPRYRTPPPSGPSQFDQPVAKTEMPANVEICPIPPQLLPFSISAVASRADLFHAASLARLHLLPTLETLDDAIVEFSSGHPSMSVLGDPSPTNYTFYPWTMPTYMVPSDGTCSKIVSRETFEIQFPSTSGLQNIIAPGGLLRVNDGVRINSLDGIKLGLTKDAPRFEDSEIVEDYRIYAIGNLPLGRDERVYISRGLIDGMHDPNFMLVREESIADIVIDTAANSALAKQQPQSPVWTKPKPKRGSKKTSKRIPRSSSTAANTEGARSPVREKLHMLLSQFSSLLIDAGDTPLKLPDPLPKPVQPRLLSFGALAGTGIGAGPLPENDLSLNADDEFQLPWRRIHLTDEACDTTLPDNSSQDHQVIVIRRGKCSFSAKLANIPSFPPRARSLKLVVIIDYEDGEHARRRFQAPVTRPLLDEVQHTPGGLVRRNPIPMVMVSGGDETYNAFSRARAVGIKRRWHVEVQSTLVSNLVVI